MPSLRERQNRKRGHGECTSSVRGKTKRQSVTSAHGEETGSCTSTSQDADQDTNTFHSHSVPEMKQTSRDSSEILVHLTDSVVANYSVRASVQKCAGQDDSLFSEPPKFDLKENFYPPRANNDGAAAVVNSQQDRVSACKSASIQNNPDSKNSTTECQSIEDEHTGNDTNCLREDSQQKTYNSLQDNSKDCCSIIEDPILGKVKCHSEVYDNAENDIPMENLTQQPYKTGQNYDTDVGQTAPFECKTLQSLSVTTEIGGLQFGTGESKQLSLTDRNTSAGHLHAHKRDQELSSNACANIKTNIDQQRLECIPPSFDDSLDNCQVEISLKTTESMKNSPVQGPASISNDELSLTKMVGCQSSTSAITEETAQVMSDVKATENVKDHTGQELPNTSITTEELPMAHQRLSTSAVPEDSCQKISNMETEVNHSKVAEITDNIVSTGKALSQITENMCTVVNIEERAVQDGTGSVENNSVEICSNKVTSTDNEVSTSQSVSPVQQTQDTGMTLSQRQRKKFRAPLKQNITNLMPASSSVQESYQNTSYSVTLAMKQDEKSHPQCSLPTNDSGNTVVFASAESYNCSPDLTSGSSAETVAYEAPSSSLLSSVATDLLTISIHCTDNYLGDLHMSCSTQSFPQSDKNVSHENATSNGPRDCCAEESHYKENDRNMNAKNWTDVKDMCYHRGTKAEAGKLVCNNSCDKDDIVSDKPSDQIDTTDNLPYAQPAVSPLHNNGDSSKAEKRSHQMTCDNTEEIPTKRTESKSSSGIDSMNKVNISVSVLEPVPSEHPIINCQAMEYGESSHIISSSDSDSKNTERSATHETMTHTNNKNIGHGQVYGNVLLLSNDVKTNCTNSDIVVQHDDDFSLSTTSDSDDVSQSILSNNGKHKVDQCHLTQPVLSGTQEFVVSKNTPETPDKLLVCKDDSFAGEEEQYLTLNSHEAGKISNLTVTSSDTQVESVSEITTRAGVSSQTGIVASKPSCTKTIRTSINNSCEMVSERGNVITSHTGIKPDRQFVPQDKDCRDPLGYLQIADCEQSFKRSPDSEIDMSNVCTSTSSSFPYDDHSMRHAEITNSLLTTQLDHRKDDHCPVLAVSHSSTTQKGDQVTDHPQHIQIDFIPNQTTKPVDKTLCHPAVVISAPNPAVMTNISTTSAISRSPIATVKDSSKVASSAYLINHNHSTINSSTVVSECSSAAGGDTIDTDHISHSLTAMATIHVRSASPSVDRLVQWTAEAQCAAVQSESGRVPISASRDTGLTNHSETIQTSLHMSSVSHSVDRSTVLATADNRDHSSIIRFPANTTNMSSNINPNSDLTSNGGTSTITSDRHQTDENVGQPSHATSIKSPMVDIRGKTDNPITWASAMREHIVQADMSPGLMCHTHEQMPVSQGRLYEHLSCNGIGNSTHKQNVHINGQPKFQSMFNNNSMETDSNLINSVTSVHSDIRKDVAHINLDSNKPQIAERRNSSCTSETRSVDDVPQNVPDCNITNRITTLPPILSPQTVPISTTETSQQPVSTTPSYSNRQVNEHNKTATVSKTSVGQWKIPEDFQDTTRIITRQTSINSETAVNTIETPEPSVSFQVPTTPTCSNIQVNEHNKTATVSKTSVTQWKIPEDFQDTTRIITRQTLISSDSGMSTIKAPGPPDSLQVSATPRYSNKHMNNHDKAETTTTSELSENQYKIPEDFQETAKTLPKQTSVDQDTDIDITDSQLFQLSAEDFEQDFETCTRKPVTKEDDPVEAVDDVEVQDQCDLAQREALEGINQKRVEGENLLATVMANLVSINRQLLKMKREMEMMKRRMGQQQQPPLQQQHHITRFPPSRGARGGGNLR